MERPVLFTIGILKTRFFAAVIGSLVLTGHTACCQPAHSSTERAVEAVAQKLRET